VSQDHAEVRLTGVHHVALTVTDVDRSARWYREVLGFQDSLRYRNEAIGVVSHRLVHPQLASVAIALKQHDVRNGRQFEEHTPGLDHLAFAVGGQASLAAWRRRLDLLDIAYSITDLPEISILVLRDPDNIQLELCTDVVATERSSIDASGRLRLPEPENL
jgi:glyoxylase I family protein